MAMKPKRPVEEWIDKAIAMRAAGKTYAEIAVICGVHDDTVRSYVRKRQFSEQHAQASQQQPPQQDIAAEIQAMRQAAQRVTPVIEAPAVDMRQVWQQYETANAATILKVQARREFRWSIPGNEPFAIAFPSDQHISLGPVDMRQMRIDAECIASTPRMACVLVGDGVDNHIKHRSAVLAASDAPDMQWMLYEHYLTLLRESIACIAAGNHDCVDLETEALTKRGWLRHDEITVADEVLGFDTETGETRWQPIERIHHKVADETVQFESRACSMRVTTNHRVLFADKTERRWQYGGPDAAFRSARRFPVSGSSNATTCNLTDDEIRLLGWIMTDGWISYNRGQLPVIGVCQRESNASKVREVLQATGVSFRERRRVRDIKQICGVVLKSSEPSIEFGIHAESVRWIVERLIASKAEIPPSLWTMDDRQFDILLDVIIEADGTPTDSGNAAAIYGSEEFLSMLQMFTVQHGWASKLSKNNRGHFILNVCRRKELRVNFTAGGDERVTRTEGPQRVWCLSVPLTNFFVRRRGRVHVTGNCWSKQIGGVDMVAKMAAAQKLCYTPDEAYLTAELGGVEYVIGVRHQYRMNSSFNQTHSVKQWLRNGMKPFDIGVIGHHHEHAQETAWIMGRMRWFARPGSYQITSGYAAQYGFNDAMPTTPTVVIYPQERQIVGFDTCHKAARWLRAEGVS